MSDTSSETLHEEVQRRVYEKQVEGKGTYRIEGPVAVARAEEVDSYTRVDDISRGKVALVAGSDEPDAGSYVRLDPEAARELGQALINASEYAEDQVGEQDE